MSPFPVTPEIDEPHCTQPDKVTGRVLVVDDHDEARESIAEILRHADHQVDSSPNAAEALRKLEADLGINTTRTMLSNTTGG